MSTCFVYVIGQEAGPVKIGISVKPSARVSALQTGCPLKISLLHVAECGSRESAELREKIVHQENFSRRLTGEWFELTMTQARESVEASAGTVERMTEIGAM